MGGANPNVIKIMDAVTTTATGTAYYAGHKFRPQRTFQAIVAGTGSVSATVLIEVSLNNSNWELLATIALTGTTSDSDGGAAEAPWQWYRARVSAISGTGAAVTVWMGS